MIISFLLGPWFIRKLVARQIGQTIRPDGPQSHLSKAGTPTMGGTLILFSLILATLLLADLTNRYVWLVVGVTIAFGGIGFIDDYRKLRRGHARGLSGRSKLVAQFAVAFVVAFLLCVQSDFSTSVFFPFFKELHPNLGWWYVPFAAVAVVGMSNAVNLTDGLDGLAIGPVMTTAFTYGVFAYVTGNIKLAEYLQIPYVPGAGELAIFCGALVCAGLGFLWFNAYPAEMFMGDVGSLPLGAALGTGRAGHQAGDRHAGRRRSLRRRGAVRDLPGGVVQAAPQAHLPHGADPSPLRAAGLAGAADHRPLLDHLHHLRRACTQHAETPMTLKVADRRFLVVGAGKTGQSVAAFLARHGGQVRVAERARRQARGSGPARGYRCACR